MNFRAQAEAIFKEELSWIVEPKLKEGVLKVFETSVPKYFFIAPASASGKYHPAVSNGEYGLLRHTKLACWIAKEMFLAYGNELTADDKEIIIAALLLHDIVKFGNTTMSDGSGGPREATSMHGIWAANICSQFLPVECSACIAGHMGIWTNEQHAEVWKHRTKIVEIAHLADYIASRKIDTKAIELMQTDFEGMLNGI